MARKAKLKFYVVKQGTYTQGVYGPYLTREEARASFQAGYETGDRRDFDGYHEYTIVEGLPLQIGKTVDYEGETIRYELRKES